MRGDYCLGYLRFEVKDAAAWSRLMTDVVGASPPHVNGGTTSFRLDSYTSRIQLSDGPLDDIAAVGLVARSQAAFNAAIGRLETAGVAVAGGTAAEAEERYVERFVRFVDIDGNPFELALNQAKADSPFSSDLIAGGFDAEDHGIGHIVLRSNDLEKTFGFYCEVFGGRVSDTASQPFMGLEPLVGFMALGDRHHALGWLDRAPWPWRTVHFALEVADRSDVGAAYDRARQMTIPIVQELGMHPDGAFSFYAETPSGFPWEIGADMMEVGDDWQPRRLDRFSLWGHRRVAPLNLETAEGAK